MRLFHKTKEPQFDSETVTPAIRKSICTGEAVAGFQNRKTGQFSEVMLIRTPKDLDVFKAQYGIDGPIKTIY